MAVAVALSVASRNLREMGSQQRGHPGWSVALGCDKDFLICFFNLWHLITQNNNIMPAKTCSKSMISYLQGITILPPIHFQIIILLINQLFLFNIAPRSLRIYMVARQLVGEWIGRPPDIADLLAEKEKKDRDANYISDYHEEDNCECPVVIRWFTSYADAITFESGIYRKCMRRRHLWLFFSQESLSHNIIQLWERLIRGITGLHF